MFKRQKKNFTFSDFSIEMQVLIRAGETALDKSKMYKLEEVLINSHPNWERVYELACIHQIRPLLLKGFSHLKDSVLPQSILDKLKKDCFRIATRNLSNANETFRLLDIFKENDIVAIPYKGAYLASTYYKDLGLREFSDIDLFVNEEDIFRVKDVMMKDGYKPVVEMTEMQEKWEIAIGYDYNFQKKDERGNILFHVEPHYRSNAQCHNLDIRPRDFILPFQIKNVMGKKLFCLSEEANLVTVFTRHGIQDGWLSLKGIFDFKCLSEQENLNWEEIYVILDKHKVKPSIITGLGICEVLFENSKTKDELNNQISKLVADRMKNIENYKPIKSNIDKHLSILYYRLTFDKSLKTTYYHLLPIFYPSKSDFANINLPRSSFFIYFFIRPLRLMYEYIFKKRY